ncbi:MAG: hypothetical protein DRN81_03840 [Thermoproteota archaeon]|nr:MAG: hypothetical protein DRN81_03840 [Candidatus Korarchaeota archaeon]
MTGLAKLLMLRVQGIGEKRAEKLDELFGTNLLRTLLETPEIIKAKTSCKRDSLMKLVEEWKARPKDFELVTRIADYGLSLKKSQDIAHKLGPTGLKKLHENPYLLCHKVKGVGFKTIDTVALHEGYAFDGEHRIDAALHFCLTECTYKGGHIWTDVGLLTDKVEDVTGLGEYNLRNKIQTRARAMLKDGEFSTDSSRENVCLSLPNMFSAEQYIHAALRGCAMRPTHLAHINASGLNKQQQASVEQASASSMSLISGKAGTGKTYVINTLAHGFRDARQRVILCAPTGKAARRITSTCNLPASTIHSLLHYDGQHFGRGPSNPLDGDVIIIDEMSMVDSPLLNALLRATNTDKTRIIFVGDHNQLPPVGPGSPLRDMVTSQILPSTILNECVRQAGTLEKNASAILDGQLRSGLSIRGLTNAWLNDRKRGSWVTEFSEKFRDPYACQSALVNAFLAARSCGYHYQDIQVLSPIHKGAIGTIALNLELQALVQGQQYGVRTAHNPRKFYLHDRVIQVKNDKKLGVMNGDVGTVVYMDHEKMIIDFLSGEISIPRFGHEIKNIELAYCITIHKCQGSEFPCIILPIHSSHFFSLYRSLVYTGATRAEQLVIIVADQYTKENGRKWGPWIAVKNTRDLSRRTLLRDWCTGE